MPPHRLTSSPAGQSYLSGTKAEEFDGETPALQHSETLECSLCFLGAACICVRKVLWPGAAATSRWLPDHTLWDPRTSAGTSAKLGVLVGVSVSRGDAGFGFGL